MPQERLHKIIANAGIASRRAAEELITTGRVSVNGTMVTELGAKADSGSDQITVDGKPVIVTKQHMYLMMHKPKGYVTTLSDPEGRPTVMDLLPPDCPRVYPVGRLDYLTEGLLLFTNDGDLAYKLTKASSHVPKTYLVKVAGQPTEEDVERLRRGIKIEKTNEEGRGPRVKTAPAQIRWVRFADNPWLEVTLIEGRNRQIRKMFEEIGHHVEKIRRTAYGPIELDLETGALRSLKLREVYDLRQSVNVVSAGKAPSIPETNTSPKTRKFLQIGATRDGLNDRKSSKFSRGSSRPTAARPARREFRPDDRASDSRPPRREGASSERPPRRDFRTEQTGERPPRREFRPADRENRGAGGERSPRREFRPADRDVRAGDRRPRPSFSNKAGAPASNRPYRKPEDRDRPAAYANSRPRRESQSGTRPPRRDFRPDERGAAGAGEERRPRPSFDRAGSGSRPNRPNFAREGGDQRRTSFGRTSDSGRGKTFDQTKTRVSPRDVDSRKSGDSRDSRQDFRSGSRTSGSRTSDRRDRPSGQTNDRRRTSTSGGGERPEQRSYAKPFQKRPPAASGARRDRADDRPRGRKNEGGSGSGKRDRG